MIAAERPSAEQLVLDLPLRPALGRADFLVASANREAVAWIDRWPGWQCPGLVIAGPPGSGKSHLAAVWRDLAGAGWIAGHDLTLDAVSRLVAEHANWVVDAADEAPHRPLLHLCNLVWAGQGALVMTAPAVPSQWNVHLADLSSRLATLPVARIGAPDEALLNALLIKLFADRQIQVSAEVLGYLGVRLERSFDAVRRLALALDRLSLSRHRPITVPLAREVLESM